MVIHDNFTHSIKPNWTQVCTGGGVLHTTESTLRLGFESAREGQYTDAQIDDYTMLSRAKYPWRPPLRLTVRSRSSLPAANLQNFNKKSGILQGTAGFGFWNNPFSVQGDIFTLPEAVWFFYASPPSNMALVPEVPGWGWKAQVIHSLRLGALTHILPTSVDIGLNRLTRKNKPTSRSMQQLAGAHEAFLPIDMMKWHTYTLEWHKNHATFWVDNKLVLHAPQAPSRPLGFVAWIDNQYAIATPSGMLRFGTIETRNQWLEMDFIKIEQL